MAVVVETTLGDITIDLYTKERPRACLNFLKLCKMKYYNYNLFHTVGRDFIAQTGDPTGSRKGGESVFGVLEGSLKRYFEPETHPRIKHTITGLVSFVGAEENMIGSQFFITLAPDLTYLDDRHCVFGEVAEGLDVLELLNDAICDTDNRPYQDIRITHTVILDDPYPDLARLKVPSRSPTPSAERLQGGRIAPDEEIDETTGKDMQEIEELKAEREAKARATILEMVGDIPDAEMAPPENVLFVCKLNPVTTDDDLEIIFSRFGKIKSCEVIRDRKTGDSLQYAFIEFDDSKACEDAYFKMDNVLIDDRRIHVDFSQSVAKVKWLGKGRGVAHFDDKGRRTEDKKNDIGQGNYKNIKNREENWEKRPATREKPTKDRNQERSSRDRERSPRDRQRSSKDQQRSSRDREKSPRDQPTSSRDRQGTSKDQRSSRDREKSPRDQPSSRDRQGISKDQQRSSRDREKSPRDQPTSSRDQPTSSRDRQRSSRDRQRSPRSREASRDQEAKRYQSPSRSDRRGGRYPEERRGRTQYRPYPASQRRPERNYDFEERRKSERYPAKSYEQPRSGNSNRSSSRGEYRRPNDRRDRSEAEPSRRFSRKKEFSSSEDENAKRAVKAKGSGEKKSRNGGSSSSNESNESLDRKKSQTKLKGRKKKSESEDSSDSSSDSYRKEKFKTCKKKKRKHEDSSD